MPDRHAPGRIDDNGKQGTFRESRVSDYHEHNDGSKGYDVDIVDREYRDNKVEREDRVDRIHTTGTERPTDQNDSQAVKEYQDYQKK